MVLICRITATITGRNIKIYAGEIFASSCNSKMLFFTNVGALIARSVLKFPDIRCVVTLYNFLRISRQL